VFDCVYLLNTSETQRYGQYGYNAVDITLPLHYKDRLVSGLGENILCLLWAL
jgi:hypothetical protein